MEDIPVEKIEENLTNSCSNCDCSQENKCDNFKVVNEIVDEVKELVINEESIQQEVKPEEIVQHQEEVKQEEVKQEQLEQEFLKVDEINQLEGTINIQELESNIKGENVTLEEELEVIKNQASKIETDLDDNEVEEINFIKSIEDILDSPDLYVKFRNKLNPLIIVIAKNLTCNFPELIHLLKRSIIKLKSGEIESCDVAYIYKELFECLHKLNLKNTSQDTATLLKFLIEFIISDNDELKEIEKFEKEISKLIDLSVIMIDLSKNIKTKNCSWCCIM